MSFWHLLNVLAASLGMIMILVMAAIPLLTDEYGRATPGGGGRQALAPPPHPPR